MIFVVISHLYGCTSDAPDHHVSFGSRGVPARCVPATVEHLQIRGISSQSMTERNTRAVARTADGKVVWWDYSRALWHGPPLVEGSVIQLLLDVDGAAAGMSLECPSGLAQVPNARIPEVNVLSTVALTSGWSLESEGGTYTLDQRQVCIHGTCARVSDVGVREDGAWTVGELEVRWDSPTAARMRRQGGPWTPAVLRSPVASPSPWKDSPGERLTVGWGHGVLPGFWQKATYHCEEGTVAWLFRPLVKSEPELVVRSGETWSFSEGAEVVKCPGNFGGIWERKRK